MLILKLQTASYFTVLRRKVTNYLLPVHSVYAIESLMTGVVGDCFITSQMCVCRGILWELQYSEQQYMKHCRIFLKGNLKETELNI